MPAARLISRLARTDSAARSDQPPKAEAKASSWNRLMIFINMPVVLSCSSVHPRQVCIISCVLCPNSLAITKAGDRQNTDGGSDSGLLVVLRLVLRLVQRLVPRNAQELCR